MAILCLVAVFALSATTLVVASPALASCNTECKELKEKEKQEAKEAKEKAAEEAKAKKEKEAAEAKAQKQLEKEEAQETKQREKAEKTGVGDPWGVNDFHGYKHCDYENPELVDCFIGITAGGKIGGFFQYGNVKVDLDKSIRLQGGYKGAGQTIEVAPAVGGETLEAPLLDVDGGISVFTNQIQEQAKWPQALKNAFAEARKNKETEVDVKIEMAGNECFEVPGCISTENILFEEGVAFKLPLKVKVTGPFLEKLGGGPCSIGSDENPIHINLTTEGQGASGGLAFNEEFNNVFLFGSRLVDFGWHIPVVSGAKGCGGEYEKEVDLALNIALEVENAFGQEVKTRKGMVVLQGDLHDGLREAIQARAEEGRV